MLSPHIEQILRQLATTQNRNFTENYGAPISVNKLTSRAGTFYEKLRYLFDYKEEHTVRRSAVERKLKRKLTFGTGENIGSSLLHELIQGGYIANKSVTESAGDDIQRIADKYIWLYNHINGTSRHRERIISLAATEIDRWLNPQDVDDAVADGFYRTVHEIVQNPVNLAEVDKDMQIFIACRRSLLDEDKDSLFYTLWLRYVPEWKNGVSQETLENTVPKTSEIIDAIDAQLRHPLGWQLVPKLRNYSIYFSLIREMILQYGLESESLFKEPETLQRRVEAILNDKYKTQNEKTKKSSIRAVIYVFFTKIVLALIFELPYEVYFLNEINYLALGANIIFHPVLLFLITRGAAKPGKDNTKRVVEGLNKVLSGETLDLIYVKPKKPGIFFNFLLFIVYLALFVIVFGAIIWALQTLAFNVVSILLFVFFLTLVSYFGLRVRYNAKKWVVSREKGTLALLWTIFTLPIVRAGRWLSRSFSAINIFVFFMDFILETPFKMVLSFIDSFISFLREKEEEPY